MAKKRKPEPRSNQPSQRPKTHQQQQQIIEEPKPHDYPEEDEEVEEIEEEDEEAEEEEEEEYEEVEEEYEEEEEEEEEGDEDQVNPTAKASASGNYDDDDDGEEEPIQKLLEPFGKEELVNLLREAADKHRDVADRIRKVADEDPVHRKIFVHGLGWDTNAETLKNAFVQYGEIEECKAVCDKVSGKSKGYGFIVFKRRAGARRALKEPQKKIGNRMTACQLASIGPVPAPSAGASAAAQPQTLVSEYTQRKIYVSNVGAELDPQKLLTFFSKYGEIEEGPLGLDKHTGKPKGFCLFVYRTVEGAKKALDEPHKNFDGHILHCQKAIDGPKPGKSQQHNHHNHNHNHNHKQHGGAQFQRNDNPGFVGGGATAGTGHLMAPGGAGVGFSQGAAAAAAAQALNPALGQALTALLATQGAGLGLTNLLGTLGTTAAVTPGMVGTGTGMQGAYGNQANISSGMIGGYGNQGGMQGGYPNQQIGQGSSGRGQHGGGQYGGASTYMGN